MTEDVNSHSEGGTGKRKTTVCLDPDVYRLGVKAAEADHRSFSSLVAHLISEHVKAKELETAK